MVKIMKTIPNHCPKCDKDVEFEIEMDYVEYNGIIPCLRCPNCDVVVPNYAFSEFIRTGHVIFGL